MKGPFRSEDNSLHGGVSNSRIQQSQKKHRTKGKSLIGYVKFSPIELANVMKY